MNISGAASKRTMTNLFSGSLSKVALDHTTRMFAVELGKHKIRVNSVNPTLVPVTDMAKGFSTPESLKHVRGATPMESCQKYRM